MKCLVISQRNGLMRISSFTAGKFEVETARSADFEMMNELRKCAVMDDLHRRSIAPLKLSAALKARLPSACCTSPLMAERQN